MFEVIDILGGGSIEVQYNVMGIFAAKPGRSYGPAVIYIKGG